MRQLTLPHHVANDLACALLTLGLLPQAMRANSAQTYFEGTRGAAPFLGKHVDILHERILIVPDSAFRSARFQVEYTVRSDRDGPAIPMVFFALEYAEGFRVLFDGVELTTYPVPRHLVLSDTMLADIAQNFYVRKYTYPPGLTDTVPSVSIGDSDLKDLLFFRADFSPGEHRIVFEYVAKPFLDIATPTPTQELRYALSPASTWRSFGTLDVELDLSHAGIGEVESNMGASMITEDGRMTWHFDRMPAEEISIERRHPLNATARVLMWITPEGMAPFALVLLGCSHALAVRSFRRRQPQGLSWVLVAGGLLVPLLVLLTDIAGYELIRIAIGPHATRAYGSYSFLALMFYPVLMPVYFLLLWLWDRRCKRRIRQAAFTTP